MMLKIKTSALTKPTRISKWCKSINLAKANNTSSEEWRIIQVKQTYYYLQVIHVKLESTLFNYIFIHGLCSDASEVNDTS